MQALDPLGVYSDDAVIAALRGLTGARGITFRYERLNQANVYIEPIAYVLDGTVDYNALADIKRTAKFSFIDEGGFDFLKDRVKPWVRLAMPDGGFVEWPQGVFLCSTPSRKRKVGGIITRQVEAYDQLLVLSDEKVTARYTVAAASVVTTAIATLVAGLGFTTAITPSSLTLPAAMEWDPGTTKLRILNDLLGAVNYESAWFDENGVLRCRPYQSPVVRGAEYDYSTDQFSVIADDIDQTLDLFKVPNKWVLTVSEPDIATAIRSEYTNTNPASPTSTVSRGRTITDFRTEQTGVDQATLDAKAARLAFEASQVYEIVEFKTALMPIHSHSDIYTLGIADLGIGSKFSEHAWGLPLKAGAKMTHKARRVVSV